MCQCRPARRAAGARDSMQSQRHHRLLAAAATLGSLVLRATKQAQPRAGRRTGRVQTLRGLCQLRCGWMQRQQRRHLRECTAAASVYGSACRLLRIQAAHRSQSTRAARATASSRVTRLLPLHPHQVAAPFGLTSNSPSVRLSDMTLNQESVPLKPRLFNFSTESVTTSPIETIEHIEHIELLLLL